MELEERSEIREMIHGILDGWHDASVQREKLIYVSLNNIDSHLEKLNSKVASHEKTILENLPHTINHCPQVKTIEKIKETLTGEEAIRRNKIEKRNNIFKTVTIVIAGIALCVTAFFGYVNSKKNDKTIQKVENLGDPVIIDKSGKIVGTRGFEIKMYPNDYKKDSIK